MTTLNAMCCVEGVDSPPTRSDDGGGGVLLEEHPISVAACF